MSKLFSIFIAHLSYEICTAHWIKNPFLRTRNNGTKYIVFNLRKMNNRNKWKNYVIVTRVN